MNTLKEEDGVISVWLTLIAMCVIGFVLLILDAMKINNAQYICKHRGRLATFSCMADYDIDVYESYDVYMMEENNNFKGMYKSYANDERGIMLRNIEVAEIERISADSILKQITKNQSIEQYAIEHFASYKNPYTLGYMKRNYIYELEYIICGKETDNDNIKEIRKRLKNKLSASELEELSCSEEEYESCIIELLEQEDEVVVADRILSLMISNINRTYEKKLKQEELIVGIKCHAVYEIEQKISSLISIWSNARISSDRYTLDVDTQYAY